MTHEVQAADTGKSYLTAFSIKKEADGTAPFDSDNNPGNDKDDSNGIVRSFDNINYTLEYVTALKGNQALDTDDLYLEVTLPCTKDIATFDTNSLGWMVDRQVEEKDGKQILTGKRILNNTNDANMLPGTGTLSVGIKVKAAPNGTKIKPSFKAWMKDNAESEKKSVTSKEITASATPRVDIRIGRNNYLSRLGKYDFNIGNESDSGIKGRMRGYGISLLILGTPEKGYKGCALPEGDISFDLNFKEAATTGDLDKTPDDNYKAYFWDGTENKRNISYGNDGYWMFWEYCDLYNKSNNIPYNNNGAVNENGSNGCYDGGSWKFERKSRDNIRVTVKNYKFNLDAGELSSTMPARQTAYAGRVYDTSYNGIFSAGYIQAFYSQPENIKNITTVYGRASVSNLSIDSIKFINQYESHSVVYAVETEPPEGYGACDNIKIDVNYDTNDKLTVTMYSTETGKELTRRNGYYQVADYKTGFMQLEKESASPNITNGDNNYDLAGTQYSVYKDKACLTSPVATLTVGSNGKSNLAELTVGTYYVKETKAGKGYALDKTVYTTKVTISNRRTSPVKVNGTSVKDQPQISDTVITKTVTGEMGDIKKNFTYTFTNNHTDMSFKLYKNDKETESIKSGGTFTLHSGEKAKIEGLPLGTKCQIVEAQVQDYTGHIDYTSGATNKTTKGTECKASENVSSGEKTITAGNTTDTLAFTNNKGKHVDSGIADNILPFIILGGLAAAGFAYYYFKYKRK